MVSQSPHVCPMVLRLDSGFVSPKTWEKCVEVTVLNSLWTWRSTMRELIARMQAGGDPSVFWGTRWCPKSLAKLVQKAPRNFGL